MKRSGTTNTSPAPCSDADKAAFGELPEDWFKADRVSYRVVNPAWRCKRLVKCGLLETRLSGIMPYEVHREFRKSPNARLDRPEGAKETP